MLDFLLSLIDGVAVFALAMLGVDYSSENTCLASAQAVPVVYVLEGELPAEPLTLCDTTEEQSVDGPEVFRI